MPADFPFRTFVLVSLALVVSAQANAQTLCAPRMEAAVDNPVRADNHRARDNGRKPCEVLTFFDIPAGSTVLEVMGTQGYYSEILSYVVGEDGKVFHHNNSIVLRLTPPDQIAPIREKIDSGALSNVEWLEGELEELPLEDASVDVVTAILVLHDYYWMSPAPESTAFKELHRVLKPGGTLMIVDHSAKDSSTVLDAIDQNGIHRIEETYLTKALQKVGFEIESTFDILRHPEDDRTKAFFDRSLWRDKTDRFIVKMRKIEIEE